MSALENHAFANNPVQYAGGHVIVPTDVETIVQPVRGVLEAWTPFPATHIYSDYSRITRTDTLGQQEIVTVGSVGSDARVVFGDINPSNLHNYLITLNQNYQPNYLPMFWLPWRANETRKITLKDKRNAQAIANTGGEARHFFTSALNGCTIIIEGSSEHPTVYHLNAALLRVTQGPIDDNKTRADRAARTAQMEKNFRLSKTPSNIADPNKTPGQNFRRGATLNANHYIPNYNLTNAGTLNNANQQYLNAAAPLLTINQQTAHQEFANGTITVEHTALVFGFMHGNTHRWQFWYQKRAKVNRRQQGQPAQIAYCQYEPITQLWPGQAGHLCIRGNSEYESIFVRPLQ